MRPGARRARRAPADAAIGGAGAAGRSGVSPLLLAWLDAEPLDARTILDVGTGAGRLALVVAARARRVVGIDTDAGALVVARRAAQQASRGNVVFVVADAEQADYRALAAPNRLDAVVAHLCLSDAIVGQAAAGLTTGGLLAFAALHVEQWRETGHVSRFAYTEDRARAVLDGAGFAVDRLGVEHDVQRFGSAEEAMAGAAGLRARWEADGRWAAWARFVDGGGRTLTRSRVVALARRRSPGALR